MILPLRAKRRPSANASEKLLESNGAPKSPGRRRFIAGLGAATAAVSTGALAPIVAASSPMRSPAAASSSTGLPSGVTNGRVIQAFSLRVTEAMSDALVPPAVNLNNGDTALYPDKGGTYTKGLPHDNFGRVNLTAFASFTKALKSGRVFGFRKDHRRRHAHAKRPTRWSGLRPRSARQRAVRPAAGASRPYDGQRSECH